MSRENTEKLIEDLKEGREWFGEPFNYTKGIFVSDEISSVLRKLGFQITVEYYI